MIIPVVLGFDKHLSTRIMFFYSLGSLQFKETQKNDT